MCTQGVCGSPYRHMGVPVIGELKNLCSSCKRPDEANMLLPWPPFYRAIQMTNKSIRQCDRLKFYGMHPLVSIVENSLIDTWPAHWPNSSIDETSTIV